MMKKKIILSYLSIAVLLAAFLLLPKQKDTTKKYLGDLKPVTAKRYVPPPQSDADTKGKRLVVNSQAPGSSLMIKSADFENGGYIVVQNKYQEIGRSAKQEGAMENITIGLAIETEEGDMIMVVLYDESDIEVTSKSILITTTALSPGIILPKGL